MHIFGISLSLYSTWINPETGKAYGNDFKWSSFTKDGKEFLVIHTPKAHEFAARRWGSENFTENVPAGIEVEDGGGSGTAHSHPETRVFFPDIMSPVSSGASKFTELSLALLEDSGWYEVHDKYVEECEWGNIPNFGTMNPSDYPEHYFCSEETMHQQQCFYDLSAPA